MMDRDAEEYVGAVLDLIPRALPARSRIEADLRLHLSELMAESGARSSAVERMGSPEQVAAEFLAQLTLVPASYGRRFLAFVIDVVVIVLPFIPLIAVALVLDVGAPAGVVWAGQVALVAVAAVPGILGVAYFPVLEALFGQTAGKRLVGICVVREDGSRSGWGSALLRRLPFFMSFFPIDALFVFFTARRQRAFDKVAGTLVVSSR